MLTETICNGFNGKWDGLRPLSLCLRGCVAYATAHGGACQTLQVWLVQPKQLARFRLSATLQYNLYLLLHRPARVSERIVLWGSQSRLKNPRGKTILAQKKRKRF